MNLGKGFSETCLRLPVLQGSKTLIIQSRKRNGYLITPTSLMLPKDPSFLAEMILQSQALKSERQRFRSWAKTLIRLFWICIE